ncbi:hypothetical protein [Alkalisalibacterium limincola]|uniref:Uncharacterized protein n=1 Tax=Alkalisalibacterium limincola TaxID=2699169 RepID=A0A5C8KYR0_9GAMM|nr:hypothetical protein [Alkalisalibacterium limincola]TXK65572.1 hypothetical protein FU658_00060 [Alkalisalibacterium limincola]
MIKQKLLDNLKNLRGWRSNRKLVALAVDDYCNVRVASRVARDRLAASGLDLSSHFDQFDAMETRQDLEALFEVLDSVRDGTGDPRFSRPMRSPPILISPESDLLGEATSMSPFLSRSPV